MRDLDGSVGPNHFMASTDEDAAQRWRKRSERGEAGAHCVEIALRTPEKPVAKYPTELKVKLHHSYVQTYLEQKIGVHPTKSNTRLAKNSWPIRLQDTEVTATFKARGNQDNKLFMTPSEDATTMPQKQFIRGDDILGINLVSKPTLPSRRPAQRDKKSEESAGVGMGRRLTFEDFKQRFIFPFSLRAPPEATTDDRMAALQESYNTDREGNRKIYGKAPSRGMVEAYERRTRRAGSNPGDRRASTSSERAAAGVTADMDVATLSRRGIPWNPFIDEDLVKYSPPPRWSSSGSVHSL